jgi:hypothetical protein
MMKVPGDENTAARFWVYFSAGSDRVPFLEPSAESLDLDAYAWGLSDAHGIPALDFGPCSAREFLYGAGRSADFGDTRLYSKIRNPIYVFGSIAIAGILLFLGRPYLLLIFVVLIPLQWFRMGNETRVLEAEFGDEYRSYRRATWF